MYFWHLYIYISFFSLLFKRAHYWPKEVKQASHGTPGNFHLCHNNRQLPLSLLRIFPFIFYKRRNIVKYNSRDTDCSANKDGSSVKTTAGEKVVALRDSLKWPVTYWSSKCCRQYTRLEVTRSAMCGAEVLQKSRPPWSQSPPHAPLAWLKAEGAPSSHLSCGLE